MIKKVVGILIVGLLTATILPVGSSIAQTIDEEDINALSSSQIEIKIKGGFRSIHAIVKNTGTTDLNNMDWTIVLDGPMIFPGYKNREGNTCIEADSVSLWIIPVFGFGPMNIEITIDTTTVTASATIFGRCVFGVQ